MQHDKGFTLIELMIVISITATLASIALPAYRSYINRAYAAEVLIQHDGMRTKALSASSVSGNNLCNWNTVENSDGIDEAYDEIDLIASESLNNLAEERWITDNSTSGISSGSITNTALLVEYTGVGWQGVNRIEALAKSFKSNGLFHEWKQQTELLSSFTAFIDQCKEPKQTLVIGLAITGDTGIASSNQLIDPEADTESTEPESTPEPTGQESELQVLSPSQRRQQCRSNCSVIFTDKSSSSPSKADIKKARKKLKQCRKECNAIR